jgi:prolyl-tRNA synthetase
LIGIPHRLTVGDRALERGVIEYANRASGEKQDLEIDSVLAFIEGQI